jgi:hypothetical protein
MKRALATSAALLAAIALAGCSGGFPGFGGPKKPKAPLPTVDPNLYPSNYRQQIAYLLSRNLTDRADFFNAMIAPPALKPVADSTNLHYVVCVLLNGHNVQKTKVVIYLGGDPTQFVDATPQQCDGAAYQPFAELKAQVPK